MSKVKVLLIDDDEDDYILTKNVFSEIKNVDERYELTWVSSFDKGINAALKQQFNIYLVDYRLGKLTGLDLLKEAMLSGVKQPIIILTGKGDDKIDEAAMNIGAADYLIKDKLDADGLDRSLRYALNQSGTLKALKESENKFKIIFDKAKEPILISDYNGKIHDINKAGLDFFGYHIKDVKVITDRQLFFTQDDRDNFIQELETKGATTDFECQMVSSKGDIYFCSLSSFLQMDTQNMLEVYHTIIHDLTHRRQAETKLINESKVSISANIATGFAEEVRNPLSTINLTLNEIGTDETLAYNEALQVNLDLIKVNFNKIDKLVKHFVAGTAIEPLKFERVGLNYLVRTAIAEVEDLLLGQRIVVEESILPNELYLSLDKSQIKKALVNLFHNAIESMQAYPKVLKISTLNDSGYYSILIEDNGEGISKEFQERIFEPFFSTKRESEGLGLPEVERIMLAHNGIVTYRPQQKGSLFIIQFPIT